MRLRIAVPLFVLALSSALLAQNQTQKIAIAPGDETAAQQAGVTLNEMRALTDLGSDASRSELIQGQNPSERSRGDNRGPVLFPADLRTIAGRPVLQTTTLNNIFINQPPSAWGDPVGFLNDLNHSRFIHITDQYVGVDFDDRYPQGQAFAATVTPGAGFADATTNNIITIGQVLGLVHAAGSISGVGLGHIYNVFIPPGTDTCSNNANTSCFSPDHPATFRFCAFHGAVTFTDIGTVLFSVEPETGVPGCASQQPSPNGIVADSVDDTLSHETFETITDPLLNAWFNRDDLDLRGAEIGDECQPVGNAQAQFLVPTFRVNGHPYAIQLEYSNAGHGCFSRPQGDED
jgi:hypothetical protein